MEACLSLAKTSLAIRGLQSYSQQQMIYVLYDPVWKEDKINQILLEITSIIYLELCDEYPFKWNLPGDIEMWANVFPAVPIISCYPVHVNMLCDILS